MLQSCHSYPGVVEIMVNSYEHLKPTNRWRSAIPDDSYEVGLLSFIKNKYEGINSCSDFYPIVCKNLWSMPLKSSING